MTNDMSGANDAGRDLPDGYPFQSDWEITPRDAAAAMRSRPGAFIAIDCREPSEWETARVDGMVLIPLGEIQSRIEEIESLAANKGNGATPPEVAVICHHGRRSMKAAMLLRQLGIDNAMSIAGGIDWWSRSVDARVPRYTKDPSGCRIV
jgi:rhodanese-related sulfurtransferase